MIRNSVLNDTCKKLLFYDQRVCTVIMGDNLQNYLVHMHDKSEFLTLHRYESDSRNIQCYISVKRKGTH